MSTQDLAAIATAIVTVLAGVFAGMRWIVIHYLNELRPNSGSSVKDQITRLEARVDSIFELLSK